MNASIPVGVLGVVTPDELAVMRERARHAARRSADLHEEETTELLQLVSRGQSYALPLGAVDGVAELSSIASVPRAPAFVKGLVAFRGEVMLAIELSGMIGNVQVGFADLRRVVCVSAGRKRMALLAERALTVRSVRMSDFISDPMAHRSFVVGTNREFLTLLDPVALIEHAFEALTR